MNTMIYALHPVTEKIRAVYSLAEVDTSAEYPVRLSSSSDDPKGESRFLGGPNDHPAARQVAETYVRQMVVREFMLKANEKAFMEWESRPWHRRRRQYARPFMVEERPQGLYDLFCPQRDFFNGELMNREVLATWASIAMLRLLGTPLDRRRDEHFAPWLSVRKTDPPLDQFLRGIFERMSAESIIVTVGATLTLLMLLFAPFKATLNNGSSVNHGYAFILSPPTRGSVVDVPLLLAQWIVVWVVAAAVWFTNRAITTSRQ